MKAVMRTVAATLTAAMIALVLAQIAAAAVSSYSADYDVLNGRASVKVTITLSSKVLELDWGLPEDADGIAVEGLSFKVVDLKTFKRLQVDGQLFDTVTFTYSTSSVLEKTRDSFFLLDIAGVEAAKKAVTVRLPPEATLKYSLDSPQSSVFPKTDSIRTDGKRIIVSWNETALANGAILVIYNEAGKASPALAVAAVAVLAAGIAIAFYRRRKAGAAAAPDVKTAAAPDLTRNLFEDEKKIVELLLTAGEEGMWQKQLEIKSGISKVKLSRKLRSIEQKGLIEKIPYGNSNKIRLKKA